jgi:glycogen operon protein
MRVAVNVLPGRSTALGATWDGFGVNFAVYSEHATGMELCLFSATDGPDTDRLPLTRQADGVWSGYVAGLAPGQLYGFRGHGPYAPRSGLRFNPSKLLLDPYARAIAGSIEWGSEMRDFVPGWGTELTRSDLGTHRAVWWSAVSNRLPGGTINR